MSISKSERMRAGLRPSTITRSASSTASSMLWVTMKMARGRHLLVEPQLQQLGAQVLRGEHIERRERLVHEQHFRLDHQRAREADALLHAAGEFLGIRGLEAVEADGVDHLQRALVALDRAACRARPAAPPRSPAPSARETARSSGRRWRHSESARPSACRATAPAPDDGFDRPVSMRSNVDLPEPDGPSKPTIFPGRDLEVGGRNHLDAIAVGLRVVLLDRARLNDGFRQCCPHTQDELSSVWPELFEAQRSSAEFYE